MRKISRRHIALWRFGMPVMAALVLAAVSGCSVPSVFGSDDSPLPLPPPLEAGDDGVVADNTGRHDDAEPATADEAGAETDGKYPELADVPEGEKATRAAEKGPEAQNTREQLARELVADREQAKHTDEELRGGRVAAAEPPRPEPPAPPRAETDTATEAQEPGEMEAQAAAPRAPEPVAQAPAPISAPAARPAMAAVPLTPQAPRPASPRPAAAPAVTDYSSVTFQPSRAQPLPADLAASLPAGVAQRYQETLRQPVAGVPVGLPAAPLAGGRAGPAYVSIPFASGSSSLSGNDRRIIAQVASSARGGFSLIRVVGHASSSASSRSESERLMANWEVSQARATAVADELIRQGVDAARVVIEAVGDSQAAYGGTGMDAEAAARRVDLFLE